MSAGPRRVVVLGASNVTFGFPRIVAGLRAGLGPVELLAAHGHGRSYGTDSSVLFRRLPGILPCALWDALDRLPRPDEPPLALVTDIGNDLMYGAPVERILEWVDGCLERLRAHGAEIVLTTLPMDRFRRLGPFHYRLFKAVLFPGKGPKWGQMQRFVPALDLGLAELAARRSAVTFEPQPGWYGLDPIHIRRPARSEAWGAILASWSAVDGATATPPPGIAASASLWRLRPATRVLLGRRQQTPQPCTRLEDGTTIALY